MEENVWTGKLFFVDVKNSREEKDEIILRLQTFFCGEEKNKKEENIWRRSVFHLWRDRRTEKGGTGGKHL